mmetsp:Transcript_34702/g.56192  ORF Transcript_34702/g.56192 Transcript_34702/m.56192 type:complete len:408 (-) Transcript_34702:1677-2900(-)
MDFSTTVSSLFSEGEASGDTIRVLCLDGGGTRGVVQIRLLEEIEAVTGKQIHELFDFISGTSIGGISTLALVCTNPETGKKYTASDVKKIFYEDGSKIFDQSWGYARSFWNLYSPKYNGEGIEGVLKKKFGDARLSSVETPVLVTAYNVTDSQAFSFFSPVAKRNKGDAVDDFLLRDAGRATSAAPSFFPSFQLNTGKGDPKTLVDGGFAANNPTVPATIAASFLFKTTKMFVVSIGCGFSAKKKNVSTNRGMLNWAGDVFPSMNAANAHITHRSMEFLAKHLDQVNKVPDTTKPSGTTGLKKLEYTCYRRFNIDLTPVAKGGEDLADTMDNPNADFLDKLVKKVEERYLRKDDPNNKRKKFDDMVAKLQKIGDNRSEAQAKKIKEAEWEFEFDANIYDDHFEAANL